MTDSIDKILWERAEKQARDIVFPPYGAFEKEIGALGQLGRWVTLDNKKMTMQSLIRKFRTDRTKAVAARLHEKITAKFVKKVDSIALENANNQPLPGGTA